MLSKQLLSDNRVCSEHVLRTALVTNMLSLSYVTHPDNDIPGIISKKKKQDVFKIYCQLLRVFEKWDKLDDLIDIQLLQKDQFGKIINSIIPLPNDDQIYDESIHTIITENFATFIPEYPYPELEPLNKLQRQPTFKSSASKMNHSTNIGNTPNSDENPSLTMYYPLVNEM